jgi:16S rRNA (adenine1518-N6/adenine1519-N6)-dimethyltransferase
MLSRISETIASLNATEILEIGAGHGALTQAMGDLNQMNYYICELDDRFVEVLKQQFPSVKAIFHEDFLRFDFSKIPHQNFSIIGNFPYNISTQIIFKIIENHLKVDSMVGMFQKEVAKRICAKPKSKDYSVLSIIAQMYYDCHYEFDVPNTCFEPVPKVTSGIISMKRKPLDDVSFEYHQVKKLVKAVFNQRRKTLRNSLKSGQIQYDQTVFEPYLALRPEQISLAEFLHLSQYIQ